MNFIDKLLQRCRANSEKPKPLYLNPNLIQKSHVMLRIGTVEHDTDFGDFLHDTFCGDLTIPIIFNTTHILPNAYSDCLCLTKEDSEELKYNSPTWHQMLSKQPKMTHYFDDTLIKNLKQEVINHHHVGTRSAHLLLFRYVLFLQMDLYGPGAAYTYIELNKD